MYHMHATPVPRPYWELQPDVCMCRLPSGNTGRGSVCVGLNVLTHLRVMCTPESTTRPRLSRAWAVTYSVLASLFSALHPLILTQLPVSIIPALLVVTRERKYILSHASMCVSVCSVLYNWGIYQFWLISEDGGETPDRLRSNHHHTNTQKTRRTAVRDNR